MLAPPEFRQSVAWGLGVVREAASWCAYGRARWWVVDWTVGGLGVASWWLRTCVVRCWTSWWARTRPLVGFSASWWVVVDWTVGGLRTTFFGFSGWGFVDGRSHPANPSRDSKIIWLGCRPPALPHIRKSRDSKRLFRVSFLAHPGPSPGSDGGPPGAGLPIKWTVGGLVTASWWRSCTGAAKVGDWEQPATSGQN